MKTRTLMKKIRKLTGKKTNTLAKIELGHMLALTYSAAYDKDHDFAINIEDRWEVILDKRGYTVCHRNYKHHEFEAWVGMVLGSAYNKVTNPATVMMDSGGMEVWEASRDNIGMAHNGSLLHKRVLLLPWINPNTIGRLTSEAADLHKKHNAALYTTSKQKPSRLKKAVWNKEEDRQIVNTGHVSFDRQTNILSTGNIIANTMYGSFIRSYQEVGCNGRMNKPGELQDFDLKPFKGTGRMPRHVLASVKASARDRSVQLYALFHWYNRGGRNIRVDHGYIMTDDDDRLIQFWNTGPTWKSYMVVSGALPYLAWTEEVKE